jgi:hypothetical protein
MSAAQRKAVGERMQAYWAKTEGGEERGQQYYAETEAQGRDVRRGAPAAGGADEGVLGCEAGSHADQRWQCCG